MPNTEWTVSTERPCEEHFAVFSPDFGGKCMFRAFFSVGHIGPVGKWSLCDLITKNHMNKKPKCRLWCNQINHYHLVRERFLCWWSPMSVGCVQNLSSYTLSAVPHWTFAAIIIVLHQWNESLTCCFCWLYDSLNILRLETINSCLHVCEAWTRKCLVWHVV